MVVRSTPALLLVALGCLSSTPAVARQTVTPTGEGKALPLPGEVFRIDRSPNHHLAFAGRWRGQLLDLAWLTELVDCKCTHCWGSSFCYDE